MRFPKMLDLRTNEEKMQSVLDFESWVLPYGDEEREKIQNILQLQFPGEPPESQILLFYYTKRNYCNYANAFSDKVPPAVRAAYTLQKIVRRDRWDVCAFYIALVTAELELDERLRFPSFRELETRAKQYIPLVTNRVTLRTKWPAEK